MKKRPILEMRNETYYLALCYLNVIGVPVDKEKARSLFEKKKRQLQIRNINLDCYIWKEFEYQKKKRKAQVSKQGNVDAKVKLGFCFLHRIPCKHSIFIKKR